MTKKGLEIHILNQTQSINSFISNNLKLTWLPTQFIQQSTTSFNLLPVQINHPNNTLLQLDPNI